MKATTLRPLLIVLLFGFLPTSGWMIVRGGADHTVTRVITNSCPMPGAAAHAHAARPWPGNPPAGGRPGPGAAYAQPSARIAPHAARGPADQAGAQAPQVVASAYPDDGFGQFSVPGALPGPQSGAPAELDPALGGPLDSGSPGDPGDPNLGLLDPPGGTGGAGTTGMDTPGTGAGGTSGNSAPGTNTPGTSPGGQSQTSSNGNHQLTAPEPSTLALFLAGTAALGFALRRRRLKR